MLGDKENANLEEVLELLQNYFPECKLQKDIHELLTGNNGEVMYKPEQLLSYLQTVFFEEHLLEIQLDQITRTFFTMILDDLPPLEQEETDGENVIIEPEYEQGSYLQELKWILLTPLEPSIGNLHIRTCSNIVLRFFSGTNAVEFGCKFQSLSAVRDNQALKLSFPQIGRLNKNFRSFRVKTVSTVDARVFVEGISYKGEEDGFPLCDISAMGVGFQIPKGGTSFGVKDQLELEIRVSGFPPLLLGGMVRHITKVRDEKGMKHICGIQFDLKTRALAAEIERLVAGIQRLQLREMAEKTADLRGVRLIK